MANLQPETNHMILKEDMRRATALTDHSVDEDGAFLLLEKGESSSSSPCSTRDKSHHTSSPFHIPPWIQFIDFSPDLVGKVVGRGSFSEVVLVSHMAAVLHKNPCRPHPTARNRHNHNSTNNLVLKRIHHDDPARATELKQLGIRVLMNEIRILSQIQPHPHIIPWRGIVWETECCSILLDRLVEILTLRLLCWRRRKRRMTMMRMPSSNHLIFYKERLFHATNLASAVAHLHDKRIIHQDIKPSNIGFDRDGILRLFDFGLSQQLTEKDACYDNDKQLSDDELIHVSAIPKYMAPEVAHGIMGSSFSSDVYSFSLILGEMITCQKHRPSTAANQSRKKLSLQMMSRPSSLETRQTKKKKKSNQVESDEERRLMALILQGGATHPRDRPTMSEMHNILQDILSGM
eukprot:scaffold4875_cov155-Amphora_coffeaeformis.AAC.3